jgi:hypothetical protein
VSIADSLLLQAAGYASDALDESEDAQQDTPAVKKRKLTKAAEAKLKAKEKAKKKKGQNDDADDNDDDSEDDVYNALSKSFWSNNGSKPPVGDFEDCARCEKQFTVVRVPPVLLLSYFDMLSDQIHHGCKPRSWVSLPSMRESVWIGSVQETLT